MNLMPVTTILQAVTSSVDFGSIYDYPGFTEDEQRTAFWEDVISTKASDTGFGHLVDSILTNGWSEASAVGWCYYDDQWEITEGHHRLVAAILLGLDFVPTEKYGSSCDNYYISAHENCADPYPIEV